MCKLNGVVKVVLIQLNIMKFYVQKVQIQHQREINIIWAYCMLREKYVFFKDSDMAYALAEAWSTAIEGFK